MMAGAQDSAIENREMHYIRNTLYQNIEENISFYLIQQFSSINNF